MKGKKRKRSKKMEEEFVKDQKIREKTEEAKS